MPHSAILGLLVRIISLKLRIFLYKSSCTRNKYPIVAVDEYSRFLFAFPCPDISAQTVISCLRKLFSLFGCPASIHSDQGAQFLSKEVSNFLMTHGVAMTHSTPYHPQGNSQCERVNGTIWRTVLLALRTCKLDISQWELVLDHALHSMRSLLCTATNQTPHERLFSFSRKSSNGYSLPTWLTSPEPILLRKFVRTHKSDPLVETIELVNASPHYARILYPDGKESTVSTSDLAPAPKELSTRNTSSLLPDTAPDIVFPPVDLPVATGIEDSKHAPETEGKPLYHPKPQVEELPKPEDDQVDELIRRSTRIRKPVDRLSYS